jgi:hypothetical protein
MCNGRSDAGIAVNAQANGTSKYVLNIKTDGEGNPKGRLILGQGPDRVSVSDFCRMWAHLPGQPPGPCGREEDIGTTNVHAVGLGTLDGEAILVRTDIRETDEGIFFRVRYRPLPDHGEDDENGGGGCEDEGGDGCGEGGGAGGGHEDGGCDDESWTRIPAEGWLPLQQLNARGTQPSALAEVKAIQAGQPVAGGQSDESLGIGDAEAALTADQETSPLPGEAKGMRSGSGVREPQRPQR